MLIKTPEQFFNYFMEKITSRDPGEREFHQAVHEVTESLAPFLLKNPHYISMQVLERIAEPERIIMFRVPWMDDAGKIHVNRGFRVEMNSAIGPYKGGLRFHPSVNLGILKFLAFEQVFKNSLTGLPLGGGKGGSDFDPKDKSDAEVMRFCQAFMAELQRHIGPYTDVPAGDIGVGGREIGFLFGQYKKLRNEFTGALTGKNTNWGSNIRPEATGYGNVYFTQEMLAHRGDSLKGKIVAVSGSGNVAQFTVEKVNELEGKVVTLSDSNGFIHDPEGIDNEKLKYVKVLKNDKRGRIKEYVNKFPGAKYYEGFRPWSIKCDIALPSATENEINEEDAQNLIQGGCICVSEGSNMSSTPEAINLYLKHKILYGPSKAGNAGGVAVSGLEMSQNATHTRWTRKKVDIKLRRIMDEIHKLCVKYGEEEDGYINYQKGANIGGFVKVADSMIAQGLV